MEYLIRIGEAEVFHAIGGDEDEFRVVVRLLQLDDAPADTGCDRVNSRHPPHDSWARFCEDVHLTRWFYNGAEGHDYNENLPPGKLACRSKCSPLTVADAKILRETLEWYRRENPDITGEVAAKAPEAGEIRLDHRRQNLARLVWLSWWADWAVENCVDPAIDIT